MKDVAFDKTLVLFLLVAFVGLINVVAFLTLPDGKYCRIEYWNQTVEYPKSVCDRIHSQMVMASTGGAQLRRGDVDELLYGNATRLLECPPCPEEIPCPVCPKPAPCPSCPDCPEPEKCPACPTCPSIREAGDCDLCVSRAAHQAVMDLRAPRTSPAYQGGCYDCKREILRMLGGNYSRFREAPSSGWYEHVYGRGSEEGLICFPDQSGGKKASFTINNSVWMISGDGSMKDVYKREVYA